MDKAMGEIQLTLRLLFGTAEKDQGSNFFLKYHWSKKIIETLFKMVKRVSAVAAGIPWLRVRLDCKCSKSLLFSLLD